MCPYFYFSDTQEVQCEKGSSHFPGGLAGKEGAQVWRAGGEAVKGN